MRWEDDAELADATTAFQVQGKPRGDLHALGWDAALETYRPFLSYDELGSMLEGGPAKLYDGLAAILGLDELTEAAEVLGEARRARERAFKEAGEKRTEILALLEKIDHERARSLVAVLGKKDWGLDEADALLAQAAGGTASDGDVQVLRQLATSPAPTAEAVATVVADLKAAHERQKAATGTLAARSRELADILDLALRFHQKHGDGDCPVCGRPAALDSTWHDHQAQEAARLRDAAKEATAAQQAVEAARKRANALPVPSAEVLTRGAAVGLEAQAAAVAQVVDYWRAGLESNAGDLAKLAEHVEWAAAPVEAALEILRKAAEAELKRREDVWKPVVAPLAAWLAEARAARKGQESVKALKTAGDWLKDASEEFRNERFAPIKDQAQAIWNQLRMQSNVALDEIRLTGSANRRMVDLKVTVDGAPARALGVMSQGEQNALALSLFIPRATLPESPFRFMVIDDPVQSMDPARVDGLARVLEGAAKGRQVLVFTHDDRLAEAVRRLEVKATVIEVTRRQGSAVDWRILKDPVARYLDDARAVAKTDDLPPQAARRVVPGLCRLAIEAACTEAVRRRRLGRGEAHAAVEELLERSKSTKALAALVLFDDAAKTADVLPRLDKERRAYADTFRLVNEGAHEELRVPLEDVVQGAKDLAVFFKGYK
jgi:ABC-type lipoprotein export system ATPase subunit